MKKNAGITLIALVITIIILIILAGVSINLILNDDGIVTKAQQAKENMEIAQEEEKEMLNTLTNYIENEGKVIIEGPIEGGRYDDPYIPAGFTHTEGEGTWNSGYVIRDTLGNEFVWVPCVTDQSKVKEGDTVESFKKTNSGKYNEWSLGLSPTNTNVTDVEPTEAIRTSVGTYGGFYIAAYEAGVPLDNNGNEIAPTSATATQKARSVSEATVWTNITRTNAIAAAANMIDSSVAGVKSGLISGECWDTTLQWMVNSSDNESLNEGYDTDSTGNGVYGQSARKLTGQYPINNIYDMAGNVWEWTTENCSNSYFICRGGYYSNSGSQYTVAFRDYDSNTTARVVGFRVVLYK